jgi:cytochrome bd-type quinol oxidase subunit 2
MVEVWFFILCLMVTMFIVLDGRDFGAGAIHLMVARNGAPPGLRGDPPAVKLE